MEDKGPSAPTQLGGGMGVARMKYWDENTDAEKIAALAGVVENMTRAFEDQAEQIDLLRIHAHNADGALVTKLDEIAPRKPSFDIDHFRRKIYPSNPLRRERL